jgi:thiol-disulfide isomerase/thioredoxin
MTGSNEGRPDRTWLYVALAFVVAWGGYLAVFGPSGGVRRPSVPGSFGKAEYKWRLLDLDDKPVEFSRFQGKAVFLNLWATWCGPCVAEMPSIAKLAANPRLKDVAFVCVSTDDSAAVVKTFLAGKNWPMTVLRATDAPPVFTTQGIPATFLIAPDGHIDTAELGSQDWDRPDVVELLETLAKAGK